jgi:hypothetical protein
MPCCKICKKEFIRKPKHGHICGICWHKTHAVYNYKYIPYIKGSKPIAEDKQPVPTWEEYQFRKKLYVLYDSRYNNKEIRKLTNYSPIYIAKWRLLWKLNQKISNHFIDRTNR